MNKLLSPPALERALGVRLRELLGDVDWLRGAEVESLRDGEDRGFDLVAKLPLPHGGAATLCVVCKREMRPSAFPMLANREFKPGGRPKVVVPVLALTWMSPRMAELCAEHGWSWFDLAGNFRIDVPGLLHLQHSGNAPVHERPRPTVNLGTKEACRVVVALLHPSNAGRRWTQRDMATHCRPSVSLGLVNKVVSYLRDESFVESGPDGGFRIADPVRLLYAWRDAYRFEQHERLSYFTLLKGAKLKDALCDFALRPEVNAAFAAFSAAEFQAPNVRQPKTWLYVEVNEMEPLAGALEAHPVDSGENLVVLVPGDEGVFYLADGGTMGQRHLACTNAVQTYVDVWHCGDRGREAAEAVLEQQLKPAWRSVGLKS